MKQKKSFVTIYRLAILVISISLGFLVFWYSEYYGGNDGFMGIGVTAGIFLALLLRVALIKPSNAKIAVNWFLYSIIITPFFRFFVELCEILGKIDCFPIQLR